MTLTLDTTLLLSQQIALGCYDKVDSLVTAGRFCFYFEDAAQGPIRFEWKLFPYEGEQWKQEVEMKMWRAGFEPANLEFGLAFGAQMPDEQRRTSITLLGAHAWVAVGDCIFVCLKGDSLHREIDVEWTDPEGFLAMTKESKIQFLGIKRIK